MPPTIGTNVLGRKVLYLPSFFTYGECASQAGRPTLRRKRSVTQGAGPGGPREHARQHRAPKVGASMEERSEAVGCRGGSR